MLTILLITLCLLVLCTLSCLLVSIRHLYNLEKRVQIEFMRFITAEGDKASPFADLVDSVSSVVANRVGTSVMAAIRGAIGGTMKAANAEQLESEPIKGLIGTLAPSLGKRLGKNPVAMSILQGVLNKLSGNQANVSSEGGNHRRDFDFHG